MTNATYHKLRNEFNLNYDHNDSFRTYCDTAGIMRKNMYGSMETSTENMKSARDFWKKSGNTWFEDTAELNFWIDKMPFGGYESEKDSVAVLQKFRKAEREFDSKPVVRRMPEIRRDPILAKAFEEAGYRERIALLYGHMKRTRNQIVFTYPESWEYQDANGATYDIERGWVN